MPVGVQGVAFIALGTVLLAGCHIASRAIFGTNDLIL
jgi:hypothetical protein